MSIATQYQSVEVARKPRATRAAAVSKVKAAPKANKNAKAGSYPVPALIAPPITEKQKIEQVAAAVRCRLDEAYAFNLKLLFDVGGKLAIIRDEVENPGCGYVGKNPDERYGSAIKELIMSRNHGCDISTETLRKYRIIAATFGHRDREIIERQCSVRALFDAAQAPRPLEALNSLLAGEPAPKKEKKLSKKQEGGNSDSTAASDVGAGKAYVALFHDWGEGDHAYLICRSRELAETGITTKLTEQNWFREAHLNDDEVMDNRLRKIIRTIRKNGRWEFLDLPENVRRNTHRSDERIEITILETTIDSGQWLDM